MAILAPVEPQSHFPIFHERCRDAHSWLAGRLRGLDPGTITDGEIKGVQLAIRVYARGACEVPSLKPITDVLQDELYQALNDWQHRRTRFQYQEYLASDGWERTRAKVLERARYTCEGCGEAHATQVHHLTYDDPRGEELLFNLVALCRECHEKITERQKVGG